jgi:hypothetical protein|tara:strand:- start:143 stop:343 length:201 start_codon:yes stop_codon:yes gene_type:complete
MLSKNQRLMRLLAKKYGKLSQKRGVKVGGPQSIKKQLGQGTMISAYAKDGGYIVKKKKKVVKKRKK